MKILFVCTGNTCRSAIAEWMFKKIVKDYGIKDVEISSCGVAGSNSYRVPEVILKKMMEMKIDVSGHVSRPLSMEEIKNSDLILVMEKGHKKKVLEFFPGARNKVFLLKEYVGEEGEMEVFDPIGQADEVYISCIFEIKNCLEKLLKKIAEG